MFLVSSAFILWRLAQAGWDPIALVEIGTRYSEGLEDGTEGYDGQFAYYIAMEPDPATVEPKLDVPAYRYQRILYPILARISAFAQDEWIPWTLIAIALISQVVATFILTRYLIEHQIPTRYALIYGLWVGLIVGVATDLFEPLTFACIVGAYYARYRNRRTLSYALFTLALFTKETALIFWGAAVVADWIEGRRGKDFFQGLVPGVMYGLWQIWLWITFGSFGLTSGGAMATPFEWIPYMGFIRIGGDSIEVLILFALIFIPAVIIPSLWGIFSSGSAILKEREINIHVLALLFTALAIAFLPFSTFREPLALLRMATGLVLAVILFSIDRGLRRPLNYGMFWIFLLVVIFR